MPSQGVPTTNGYSSINSQTTVTKNDGSIWINGQMISPPNRTGNTGNNNGNSNLPVWRQQADYYAQLDSQRQTDNDRRWREQADYNANLARQQLRDNRELALELAQRQLNTDKELMQSAQQKRFEERAYDQQRALNLYTSGNSNNNSRYSYSSGNNSSNANNAASGYYS